MKIYIALLFLSLSLMGCYSESNIIYTSIEGSWIRSCKLLEETITILDIYTVYVYSFSGNTIEVTSEFYNDSDCTEPNEFYPINIESGTFILGNKITTDNLVVARKIDFFLNLSNDEALFQELYDLTLIEGSNLYFGIRNRSDDHSKPELRTIEIDLTNVYRRL